MNDRHPEHEIDPAQVKWNVRLVVARLREHLNAACNHGLVESLRRDVPERRTAEER
ncbi:hypothetical protein [Saccharothrix australiensis]|uniref:Uncharacterized protein n=1 Tax=Saccharothrix australiensis TaxID=2072 RepID=A0A495W066_9PSEU|nr:hypothetical protein [Saccharothrix australiensis]RKT55081.1 hypothetical protein C8E97_3737 [Saccharothrix australiensis]